MDIVRKVLEGTIETRPKDTPIGKGLLLVPFLANGKLITNLVRFFLGLTGKLSGRNLYRAANILGPVVAVAEAYGFKHWKGLENFLGPSATEALCVATIAGAIDAGFQRENITQLDRDASDIMANAVRDKIVAGVRKFIPSGFPEAGTSGWREQQRWLSGAQKQAAGRPSPTTTRTAGPVKEVQTGEPTKAVDFVQQAEEILAAKSRM